MGMSPVVFGSGPTTEVGSNERPPTDAALLMIQSTLEGGYVLAMSNASGRQKFDKRKSAMLLVGHH